jgi:large subunit ribosomal protein L24
MKIKLGDEVLVLQGRDKGKKAKVEKIFAKRDQVVVSGVNIVKRHVKRQGNKPGGIVDLVKPLPISRVGLVCPKCNLATRVGFALKTGKKERICKKCKQAI